MIEDLIKYNKDSDPNTIADTAIFKYLNEKGNTDYCSNLKSIENDIANILTRIPAMFSNYTNHDIKHSLRIADYMVSFLPLPIENYSDTELAMMAIAAIFHDVGMSVPETESSLEISQQNEIRKNHHKRSEKCVMSTNPDFFKIKKTIDVNFQKSISLIVRAHGEDISWIENNIAKNEEYGVDKVNPLFIACLLRLGDYLDFDSRRTPLCLFNYLKLKAFSYEEWRKHFPITNFMKINTERQVYFQGNCDELEVFHQICKYFENIEKEIKDEKILLFECSDKYKLDISDVVLNNIKPNKFSSVNLQFNMDYAAITNLLMGENLYADKSVVIRELLQNSIDACLLKKELSAKKSEKYTPEIRIIIDSNKISIYDNGIGMSKKIIENYFLCIGKSYYTSEAFKNTGASFNPISHYGIGFLSCFLLTDAIKVHTVPFEDINLSYDFSIKKDDRNVEIKTCDEANSESGTSIAFVNKYSDEIFSSSKSIVQYIIELFFNIPIPINIYEGKKLVETIPIRNIDLTNRINISKYLNNVQCSFKTIVRKESCRIIEKLCPFSMRNNYIYDPDHLPDIILDDEDLYNYLQNTNESYDISHFILPNDRIQILKIYPLGGLESLKYNDYLENDYTEQEAFEKIIDKFPQESINILIEDSELLNEFNEYEKIDFPCKTGSEKYQKFLKLVENLLFEIDSEIDSFLCDIDMEYVFYNENYYTYINIGKEIKSMKKNALAFHNIRVGQYRILVPSLLDSFMPFQWYINVNTNNIFPNISRDSISSKISAELGYAIGYAYNKYLCDLETDISKKEFINQFIKKFYPEIDTNIFIKK